MTTPVCPACGAKFSHDAKSAICRACGIPDEVIEAGPRVVARWKAQHGLSKSNHPSTFNHRRRKHGAQRY